MRPEVLVFDVNETLIDIDSLQPYFGGVFGDPLVLREWFGQLVTYSMATTLAGRYTDFFTLGQGVLRMTAEVHGVEVGDDDLRGLTEAMRTMPAHPDAAEGLQRLRANGFRLVTLTNSPHRDSPTPLEQAWRGRREDGGGRLTTLPRRVRSIGSAESDAMVVTGEGLRPQASLSVQKSRRGELHGLTHIRPQLEVLRRTAQFVSVDAGTRQFHRQIQGDLPGPPRQHDDP